MRRRCDAPRDPAFCVVVPAELSRVEDHTDSDWRDPPSSATPEDGSTSLRVYSATPDKYDGLVESSSYDNADHVIVIPGGKAWRYGACSESGCSYFAEAAVKTAHGVLVCGIRDLKQVTRALARARRCALLRDAGCIRGGRGVMVRQPSASRSTRSCRPRACRQRRRGRRCHRGWNTRNGSFTVELIHARVRDRHRLGVKLLGFHDRGPRVPTPSHRGHPPVPRRRAPAL